MSSLFSSFISFLPAKYNMYKMACTGARICKNFSKNKVSSDILFAWTWRLHKQNWHNLQVKKGFFCRCCQNWFTNVPLKALLPLFWEIFPLFFFLFKGMAFWEQLCYSPSDETLSPWKVYRTEKLNSIVWKQGELSTMQKWQSQLENRVSSSREAYSVFGEIGILLSKIVLT